jgi:glycosyltransferase involved in cell wall biosynthesis
MTKRYLVCLFTYNRPDFMLNAFRSIEAFFPWGDRLLIDDGSFDPESARAIKTVAQSPNWTCKIMDRLSRAYGGFYRNMRFALDYALEQGYDYCFFFEDDEQFLWKKEDYREYIEHVFSVCPDAIQLQPLFLRRIVSYANHIEHIDSVRAYRTERAFSTTAIWNLAAVRAHGDFKFIMDHGDDLPANSAWWLRHGYRLYYQADPTVGIIPWVESNSAANGQRHRQKQQLRPFGVAPAERFIIAPLSSEAISYLQNRDPSIVAYQEYFTRSETPIWHQARQNLNRYYELCRQTIDAEDALKESPLKVKALKEWRPTTIPPLQSHLTWNPYAVVGTTLRSRIGKMLAQRLPGRLLDWRHFDIQDYLGYRRLTLRLKKELNTLPF